MAAVAQTGDALRHAAACRAAAQLTQDKAFMQAAVATDGTALRHASELLRGDVEVVLPAVTVTGLALQHASAALRDESDIVAAAVASCGRALNLQLQLQHRVSAPDSSAVSGFQASKVGALDSQGQGLESCH